MLITMASGLASPILVEPGDREVPTTEMPEHAFYMDALQFHWTGTIGAKNKPARFVMESIALEQYKFRT